MIDGNINYWQYFEHFVIHLQLPILIFIIYFCEQVNNQIGIKPFKKITTAWRFNLAYVLLVLLQKYFSSLEITTIKTFTIAFDLTCSYFFLAATRSFAPKNYFLNNLIPYGDLKLSFGFIIVFLVESYLICVSINNPYESLFHTPYVVINILSCSALTYYFYLLKNKNKQTEKLFYGALLYTIIQILSIFMSSNYFIFDREDKFIISAIGFTLGLISKSLIVFGLFKLFFDKASALDNEKSYSKRLTNILGRTFHELAKPIESIQRSTNELLLKKNDKYSYSNKVKSVLEVLNQSVNHIAAIVSSSSRLARDDEDHKTNSEIIKDENFKLFNYVSLNTIAQMAVLIIKRKTEKNINFDFQYSSKCNLYCNLDDIYQICLNIIQNSVDAIEKDKGVIFIKTLNLSKGINKKSVILEVRDNGTGISKNDVDNLFIEGFTTKKDKALGRGYGLAIVKEKVDIYKGKVEFESPILLENEIEDKIYNTKCTVELPYDFRL